MELKKETLEDIQKFAKEQASKNLSSAELSVFERVAKKGDVAKSKVIKNISKLKVTSDQVKDATDDLTQYMNDYIADLMQEGHTEEQALEMAKENLSTKVEYNTEDIHDKYREYYMNRDLGEQEAIGLYYAGFTCLGLSLGVIAGIILGSFKVFTDSFWLTFSVSTVIGIVVGASFALIKNASISAKNV